MLRAQSLNGEPGPGSACDGVSVAAALQLRASDLLVLSGDKRHLRQCELVRLRGRVNTAHPQTLALPMDAATRWHSAMAAHLALAWKFKRRQAAVVAVLDARVLRRERGVASDVLRRSFEQRLPIVYIAKTSPRPSSSLDPTFQEQGVPRIIVDGNDVVAVYRVCQEALRRAREGVGPTLIECHMRAKPEPVAFLETFLGRYGLWSGEWKQRLLGEMQPRSHSQGHRDHRRSQRHT
jgi:hypothetical protein